MNSTVLASLACLLVAAAACTVTPAGTGTTPATETDGGVKQPQVDAAPPISNDCTGIGKAAAPTAACCLAYGIDACGAGLVCAALDGRTQPVCYLEKSRSEWQSCTSDKMCSYTCEQPKIFDGKVCVTGGQIGGQPCASSSNCKSGVCDQNRGACFRNESDAATNGGLL